MSDVLRAQIDAKLDVLWPDLVAWQDAYRVGNGRYFQGLPTHSNPPTGGTLTTADRLASRPTDQAADWTVFGLKTFRQDYSLEIQQYISPAGHGWVGVLRAAFADGTWERWRGAGPENRDRPWTKL